MGDRESLRPQIRSRTERIHLQPRPVPKMVTSHGGGLPAPILLLKPNVSYVSPGTPVDARNSRDCSRLRRCRCSHHCASVSRGLRPRIHVVEAKRRGTAGWGTRIRRVSSNAQIVVLEATERIVGETAPSGDNVPPVDAPRAPRPTLKSIQIAGQDATRKRGPAGGPDSLTGTSRPPERGTPAEVPAWNTPQRSATRVCIRRLVIDGRIRRHVSPVRTPRRVLCRIEPPEPGRRMPPPPARPRPRRRATGATAPSHP